MASELPGLFHHVLLMTVKQQIINLQTWALALLALPQVGDTTRVG